MWKETNLPCQEQYRQSKRYVKKGKATGDTPLELFQQKPPIGFQLVNPLVSAQGVSLLGKPRKLQKLGKQPTISCCYWVNDRFPKG